MKVTMNVERIREALENPEHAGLNEVDWAVLAALVSESLGISLNSLRKVCRQAIRIEFHDRDE